MISGCLQANGSSGLPETIMHLQVGVATIFRVSTVTGAIVIPLYWLCDET